MPILTFQVERTSRRVNVVGGSLTSPDKYSQEHTVSGFARRNDSLCLQVDDRPTRRSARFDAQDLLVFQRGVR